MPRAFDDLPLLAELKKAVADKGYVRPTPIQEKSIPSLLKGRDLLGCAQTGTGKTAAFALPILQRLHESAPSDGPRRIRALVLTPTRELAAQIGESFRTYGRHLDLRSTVIFGGVGKDGQRTAVKRGIDVLVATPGRLLDLMQEHVIRLDALEAFVLDEADRMLDMGFIHDVKKVIRALPKKRQSLFFSATMPKAVAGLADSLLQNPVRVEVVPQSTPAERIDQTVLFVEKQNKGALLYSILSNPAIERALVFSRTKYGSNRIAQKLVRQKVTADAIHGDRPQNARTRILEGFRSGKIKVLVATDLAARGIDIEGITHVINYDMPNEPENYVHRIGRTARAGKSGRAISFCSGDERDYLTAVEKVMGRKVPVNRNHDFHSEDAAAGLVDGKCGIELRKEKQRNRVGRRGGHGHKPKSSKKASHPDAGKKSGQKRRRPAGRRRSGGR